MNANSINERILNSRIIFINGEINKDLANNVIMELLLLDSISNEDISLYINSPGGSVQDGLAIIDTMNLIKSDVRTIAVGTAASMAAVILACGSKGKRSALPNASILLHQIMGGMQGQASDIEITYKHLINIKNKLLKILSNVTGNNIKKLEADIDRDFWLDANESIKYGVIDTILGS